MKPNYNFIYFTSVHYDNYTNTCYMLHTNETYD
jgi:hypothetical protein